MKLPSTIRRLDLRLKHLQKLRFKLTIREQKESHKIFVEEKKLKEKITVEARKAFAQQLKLRRFYEGDLSDFDSGYVFPLEILQEEISCVVILLGLGGESIKISIRKVEPIIIAKMRVVKSPMPEVMKAINTLIRVMEGV